MLPAPTNVIFADRLAGETPGEVLDAFVSHLARTGRRNPNTMRAAAAFLHRWPDVTAWAREPINLQLEATAATRAFLNFLLVTGRVHPSWDYLVHRKFSSLWRDLPGTRIGAGAIIGANALVRGEIPANAILASPAATVIGWRRLPDDPPAPA